VTIAVVDDSGRRVADAGIPVKFSLSGAGELAGVGNGVPNDPSSFRLPQCKTFQGRCLAILRPYGTAGEIILRAEADGLEPATIVVRVQ
jgi:beta-galactosidase